LSGCGQGGSSIAARAVAPQTATMRAESTERAQADEPGWLAGGPREDLGHFFRVDDTLYRGQQPTDKGLAQLKDLGIRHVVYLHFNQKQAVHERQVVESLGMRFTHIPMSWLTPPKPQQIDTWLKLTLDPTTGPVFVHCQHGRDRTGAMVGIYRIAHDKWTFEKAYAEMKEKGFRTFFLGLSYGVKRYAKANGATDTAYTDAEMALGF
ncbi:MAG: tyrosine-protein phosphatase, partial [Candidatus Sericytochromatia bacterium]|nr:tyrosine-protein phosphatase [Candidatus Sericytochromatia bacterium]